MPLRIQTIESLEALEAIEPEWRALWQRDPEATPFQSPGWLLPWTRSLWGGGRLHIIALRSGDDLVALAPFFFWGYGRQPEVIRVSFLGAGITDHLGMIAAPDFELEAARAILGHLVETGDQWHVCELEELRPRCGLLRAELPDRLIARETACGICPVLALPNSADELYAGLDSKFRRNLRLAETRLARAGAAFAPVSPDDCADAIRALYRLHTARWRERQETGVLAADALQQFHLDAAPRLASNGLARLYALRVDGDIVAVQYNLQRDTRVYAYLSGFDPAYARCSPGAALLAFSIRAAIEAGATQFDFLRKREDFKYQWGAHDHLNRTLLISHSAACARGVA